MPSVRWARSRDRGRPRRCAARPGSARTAPSSGPGQRLLPVVGEDGPPCLDQLDGAEAVGAQVDDGVRGELEVAAALRAAARHETQLGPRLHARRLLRLQLADPLRLAGHVGGGAVDQQAAGAPVELDVGDVERSVDQGLDLGHEARRVRDRGDRQVGAAPPRLLDLAVDLALVELHGQRRDAGLGCAVQRVQRLEVGQLAHRRQRRRARRRRALERRDHQLHPLGGVLVAAERGLVEGAEAMPVRRQEAHPARDREALARLGGLGVRLARHLLLHRHDHGRVVRQRRRRAAGSPPGRAAAPR